MERAVTASSPPALTDAALLDDRDATLLAASLHRGVLGLAWLNLANGDFRLMRADRTLGPSSAVAPGRGAGARRTRPAARTTLPPRSAGWSTGSSTPRPAWRLLTTATSALRDLAGLASEWTCRWHWAPPALYNYAQATPAPASPTSPASVERESDIAPGRRPTGATSNSTIVSPASHLALSLLDTCGD